MTPADELKSATDALLLMRQRDARAWPIAEVLATMWRDGCLKRLLKVRGPDAVFVPITEADLLELFGQPESQRTARGARRAA
jgi:hypothetical protein